MWLLGEKLIVWRPLRVNCLFLSRKNDQSVQGFFGNHKVIMIMVMVMVHNDTASSARYPILLIACVYLFILALSLNGEESFGKFQYPDLNLHQNLINSSLSHTQLAQQISYESVHNFSRYSAHR